MEPIITIQQLGFQYHGESVINALDLTIHKGEWVTIAGENGSGKSTLGRLIAQLLPIQKGEIQYHDIDDVRQSIGYVFQNPENQFVGFTVEEDVAFGLEVRRVPNKEMRKKVKAILNTVGMSEFQKESPDNLSGGQKQRVALAGALVVEPKILILDEATAMLDPKSKQQMMTLLNQLKEELDLTIINITHEFSELLLGDRIIIMANGAVISDVTPESFFESGEWENHPSLTLPLWAKIAKQEHMPFSRLKSFSMEGVVDAL